MKGTILIVDDDAIVRDTLQALLFKEGYHLAFATSGQDALTRLKDINPDVILLDVMMPGMDGFEVCQKLKTDKKWQHIPIILVTALDSKEDLVSGLEAGADDFLSKPVNGLELRARVRSMLRIKQQFDALQTMLDLREDLSYMIVHDMKNPIMSIMGFSRYLLKIGNVSAEQVEDIEKIYAQAQRLHSFANDLLLAAKMEAGRLILSQENINVVPLIAEVQNNHRVIARSKNITIALELPETSQQIFVDRNLTQRVLDNLMSNALKYSPANSTIIMRAEYLTSTSEGTDPTVRIQVLDEGPGIPEEYRNRIFDKFEVVASKERGPSQVGIGLAFCKMVVDAHQGQISVANNQPKGAIFTVEL